jgi:general secretion pathway protein N
MTSKLSLLALGLGAYLAFALVGFPASVAYRWFAPPMLELAAVDGTLWRGSAQYGAVSGLAISDLRWQLHPAALITARLSVSAEGRLADGFVLGRLVASGNRLSVSDVRAAMSLQSLRGLLPLAGTEGRVGLELDRLDLVDAWPVSAVGELTIGSLSVAPLIPMQNQEQLALGDYRVRFAAAEEPGIVGIVDDEGGPLELSGQIALTQDRIYRIEALIKPRPDAPADLVQGLSFMTDPPNADGQRRFELAGSL